MSGDLIRLIHVGARELGLDEDTRRDVQRSVTGKDSLKTMTVRELEAVVDALKKRGFKPRSTRNSARPVAARGDVRLLHVLWGKLARAGAVDQKGAAGLNAFIRARFGKSWGAEVLDVDRMQDWRQIATVAEALKSMCTRAGIEV